MLMQKNAPCFEVLLIPQFQLNSHEKSRFYSQSFFVRNSNMIVGPFGAKLNQMYYLEHQYAKNERP